MKRGDRQLGGTVARVALGLNVMRCLATEQPYHLATSVSPALTALRRAATL